MCAIPVDVWLFLACAVFAGGVGAFAWIGSNRKTATFAQSLAYLLV